MSGFQVRLNPVLTVGMTHTKMSWHFAADAHDARALHRQPAKIGARRRQTVLHFGGQLARGHHTRRSPALQHFDTVKPAPAPRQRQSAKILAD